MTGASDREDACQFYRSRIKWRDPGGNDQSKLLLMEPRLSFWN